MRIAEVQFAPWDKSYYFSSEDESLSQGDFVLVSTELGRDVGKIIAWAGEEAELKEELKPISRRISSEELAHLFDDNRKEITLATVRKMASEKGLDMKFIDVNFSYDGGRLNFAFIADGRIDFRDLVKDLTAHFNAAIRLTQIGARDEARFSGDCGACGKGLCCKGFVKDFSSITSEMAEAQQVVHRGSERISGMCGRLMCCLSYEYEGYKEMREKMPPIGTKVNVDGRRGVVVGHHVLKQSVDVRFPSNKKDERDIVVEVDLNRHQKKASKV